ncbi:hypothetical protein LY76DRAFT_602599 [Colletotrichum caudatum]|nr:hypothetical protein LY76DRAFT_602599 [Colletotrichum caudatum]
MLFATELLQLMSQHPLPLQAPIQSVGFKVGEDKVWEKHCARSRGFCLSVSTARSAIVMKTPWNIWKRKKFWSYATDQGIRTFSSKAWRSSRPAQPPALTNIPRAGCHFRITSAGRQFAYSYPKDNPKVRALQHSDGRSWASPGGALAASSRSRQYRFSRVSELAPSWLFFVP